jgi:SAM-dependent methyltransferase
MLLRNSISAEELERLKLEREKADKAYNDALTLVDTAVQRTPDMPHPPPPLDEQQITPINQSWQILPLDPTQFGTGWTGRIKMQVWRMLAPIFEQQQRFNGALVDHINRNIPVQRATRSSIGSVITVVRDQLAAIEAFQAHLIRYLQQITLYVDTKDREYIGFLEHRTIGLAAGLNGVSDELLRRWESMVARERRYEATAVKGLADVEASVAVLQRSTLTLKRELERVVALAGNGGSQPTGSQDEDVRHPVPQSTAGPSMHSNAASAIDSYKYVGFEDQFRGSEEDIRRRLESYVPYFSGAEDVLDVGCGRGEFLELLAAHGVRARGLDVNHEMVEVCRARGLSVEEGDALTYLSSLPDSSLGGLVAAQVVEHLQPDYLMRLLETSYHKLRPGSTILLETINPACWAAFFESYIRDITHVRPLHPDTLSYLLVASGFQRVDVRFSAPYPEQDKLQPIPVPHGSGSIKLDISSPVAELAETFNENVDKINRLMFTYLDYAAVGKKIE